MHTTGPPKEFRYRQIGVERNLIRAGLFTMSSDRGVDTNRDGYHDGGVVARGG